MPGCGSTRAVMTAACHVVRRARISHVTVDAATCRELAERAWAWTLTRVRSDEDGVWLPERLDQGGPGEYSYGMHAGIGGLAHVLSETRLTRRLTAAEQELAAGIAE